jgi:hypothetical protein
MSKIDRHSDLTPSPKEQRILIRALGCGVEELVARFGAENAIKRALSCRRSSLVHGLRTGVFFFGIAFTPPLKGSMSL